MTYFDVHSPASDLGVSSGRGSRPGQDPGHDSCAHHHVKISPPAAHRAFVKSAVNLSLVSLFEPWEVLFIWSVSDLGVSSGRGSRPGQDPGHDSCAHHPPGSPE
jgi:hypothetical protein